jgi:L-asparaginase
MNQFSVKTTIKMISTGGTIEKTYNDDDGMLLNRKSVVKEKVLDKLRMPHTQLEVEMILCKDSLEMTDEDRQSICAYLREKMEENCPIVVLHGTDTMDLTVQYCAERLPQAKVPIVFTGAMVPLELKDSDAMQNVAEAVMVAKIVAPGIYLSFHNHLFQAPHFRKNRAQKTFEVI